jgi:excinuclease ABC subunit C
VDALAQRIKRLPHKPGVYLFKNAREKIIYVGKARDLRKRVTSYLRISDDPTGRLARLAAERRDVDFIITNNEVEALILEATLIKKHQPRYNVMLRDDKSYPYIKITKEKFPRLELTRRVIRDGARYFGPYSSVAGVRGTLAFLQKVFPLRRCASMKKIPCMYYHINRCPGPCSGEMDVAEYEHNVKSVELFLMGRHQEMAEQLRTDMKTAAADTHFERAAVMRDRLTALETFAKQKQEVVWNTAVDLDVVGVSVAPEAACAEVLFVRGGRLIGHDPFLLRTGGAESFGEIMQGFLEQYYAHRDDVPPAIILSHAPEDALLIKEFLEFRRGGKVMTAVPLRGKRKHLADMAVENSGARLKEEIERDLANRERAAALLAALQDRLGAESSMRRIVGFDISTIQGTNTVGSAVAFQDGAPDKAGYRKFIIQGSGRDDFSSMREMAARYFTRVREGAWPRPDLIIVDGGRGQLSAVERGIADAEYFESLWVMGFAKESMLSHVMGRKKPVAFTADEPAANMVRRVIAEAHRFAVTFHRKKRGEKMLYE